MAGPRSTEAGINSEELTMNGVGLGGDHRSNAAAGQDNRNMSARGDVEMLSNSRRHVPDYDPSIFSPKEPREERTPLPRTSLGGRNVYDYTGPTNCIYDDRIVNKPRGPGGERGCTLV